MKMILTKKWEEKREFRRFLLEDKDYVGILKKIKKLINQ